MSLPSSIWKTNSPQRPGDLYGKILEINPNDLSAVKGGKDAAAAASMQEAGGTAKEATYRDLIKDKDQAVALEQQGRVYRSEEAIDHLLGELSEKYTQDPRKFGYRPPHRRTLRREERS